MFIPITQVTDHLTDKTYKIWIPANVPIQEAIDIQYRNYFRYLGIMVRHLILDPFISFYLCSPALLVNIA